VKLLDNRKMRDLAKTYLDTLGIEIPSVNSTGDLLSGGQRQSVAVARSIYSSPTVLDASTSDTTEEELIRIVKSGLGREAIAAQKLRDAGIKFAVASARPPRGMTMIADQIALSAPIAAFNGARKGPTPV
jgi:ABC-type Fe3+/spermidine/putrescine transport system ATPase subunit